MERQEKKPASAIVDSRGMWKSLIEKSVLSCNLLESEKRAFELRTIGINLADIASKVLKDPMIKYNVALEAELVATFHQCSLSLRELGITGKEKIESYRTVESLAEAACGLWTGIEYSHIPTATDEEKRIREIQQDRESGKLSAMEIKNKYITYHSEKWLAMSEIIDFTYRLLGIDSKEN